MEVPKNPLTRLELVTTLLLALNPAFQREETEYGASLLVGQERKKAKVILDVLDMWSET